MKKRHFLNSENQLVVSGFQSKKSLVLDGNLSIDKNNRFKYWLNAPTAWRRKYGLPGKITFTGNWQINKNYDLELTLDENKNQSKDDCLVFKGEIVSAAADALVFQIKSRDNRGQTHIQLLQLNGVWQADECNQLSFQAKKQNTTTDILTLQGAWQLNKNQQITYTYEKTDLRTKTKIFNTLTFSGFWQINSTNRLTYILARSLESRFDFRVQIETPNLYPKEGAIKYRLGIGLRQGRAFRQKVICLYGAWKFSRRLGLIFQMDYGRSCLKAIEFGADVALNRKNQIICALRNKAGQPLGINITFSHRFFKKLDAEVFLRIKRNLSADKGIEAGMRIPF